MTLQELESIFQSLVDNDRELSVIRKKISEGKATFKDTAAYNERVSTLFGRTLSEHITDIPEDQRKDVCERLLRGRYIDINSKLAAVQTAIDEADGIHIAPQRPAFPSERVSQVARSLEDKTVSEDVIRRRANGPVANVSKSFHDDFIKENAAFKYKAGLDAYIIRDAAPGCCKWCSELAGRYEYGQEPEDVYHRHDNCSCTTTYENGRKRQDVWSKKEWEVPEPGAGAAPPTVFDDETRPAGFQPKVLKGLKNGGTDDIIYPRGLTKISESGRVVNPMDEVRYRRMKDALERRSCPVISAKGDDESFLLKFGAEAISDEHGIIHLGEVPSASAFFEEIIHYTQIQKYGVMSSSDFVERDAREIAANRILLKNGKAYGFSKEDFEDIDTNLKRWEQSFIRRVGVSYDESNFKRGV